MSNKPLDAGPELDAAVARALGWDFTITADGDVMLLSEVIPGDVGRLFRPSRNVATAFAAADAFDLYNFCDGTVMIRPWWDVIESFSCAYESDEVVVIAEGATVMEALSRAIVVRSAQRNKAKKPSP